MTPPRVSILTPTFNHERFIGQCIESVLSQTSPDWEMLILDDASADDTYAKAKSYGDDRIRVFRQENQGLARLGASYNRLLREAKGDLIAILEGDDYWPADRLERQVPRFEDSDVVLASGFTTVVDEDGFLLSLAPAEAPPVSAANNRPLGSAAKFMLDPDRLTFTFPVSTMVRKGALESIGGFQQPPYLPLVDYPTFLKLGLVGGFTFDKSVLGFWRRHAASTTSGRLSGILDGAYRFAFEFMSKVPQNVMTSEERDRIQSRWDAFQARRYAVLGRWLAHEGKWAEAKRAFGISARYPASAKARIGSRLAAALAGLKMPSEWLFAAARQPAWQEQARIGGDLMVSESMLIEPPRYTWRTP